MNYPVINPVETGRRINRLRKSKGLSVPYLRDYFGFSTTNAIYKWLGRHTAQPGQYVCAESASGRIGE